MKNKMRVWLLPLAVFLLTACGDKGRVVEPKSGPAHLEMSETTHDFGVVTDAQGVVTHNFYFVNDGSEPLVINEVRTYCHCTEVEYPKKPIKPGHRNVIKVALKVSDLSGGYFTRTVDVFTSGRTPTTLTIKGEREIR